MSLSIIKDCRKIIGIGRNYADHAKELGNAVPSKNKPPMFFLKPNSSLLAPREAIWIPKDVDVHHEVELAIVIDKEVKNMVPTTQNAWNSIRGYALAFDLTARNIQEQAKEARHPWTVAKGFDTFTPISPLINKNSIPPTSWNDVKLTCMVDEQVKQDGCTKDMIWTIPELIAHVSSVMRLDPGDIILTGTPKGVGPVKAGQTLEGILRVQEEEVMRISFPAIPRPGNGDYGTN